MGKITKSQPFWKRKKLNQFTPHEWEKLCDGCALCCLKKLEDEDTGDVYFTAVACRYLNFTNCRCTIYPERHQRVPQCVFLTPAKTREFTWLPPNCAYRLIHEGEDLPWWHPLVCGNSTAIHEAGASLSTGMAAVSEEDVAEDDLQDYIIETIEP